MIHIDTGGACGGLGTTDGHVGTRAFIGVERNSVEGVRGSKCDGLQRREGGHVVGVGHHTHLQLGVVRRRTGTCGESQAHRVGRNRGIESRQNRRLIARIGSAGCRRGIEVEHLRTGGGVGGRAIYVRIAHIGGIGAVAALPALDKVAGVGAGAGSALVEILHIGQVVLGQTDTLRAEADHIAPVAHLLRTADGTYPHLVIGVGLELHQGDGVVVDGLRGGPGGTVGAVLHLPGVVLSQSGSPTHNSLVGGDTGDRHMHGNAAVGQRSHRDVVDAATPLAGIFPLEHNAGCIGGRICQRHVGNLDHAAAVTREGGELLIGVHVLVVGGDIADGQGAVAGTLGLVPERNLQRVDVVLERGQHRVVAAAAVEGQGLASVVDVVVRSRPDHVGRDRCRGIGVPTIGNHTVGTIRATCVVLETFGVGVGRGDHNRSARGCERNRQSCAVVTDSALGTDVGHIRSVGFQTGELSRGGGGGLDIRTLPVGSTVGLQVEVFVADCTLDSRPGEGGRRGARNHGRRIGPEANCRTRGDDFQMNLVFGTRSRSTARTGDAVRVIVVVYVERLVCGGKRQNRHVILIVARIVIYGNHQVGGAVVLEGTVERDGGPGTTGEGYGAGIDQVTCTHDHPIGRAGEGLLGGMGHVDAACPGVGSTRILEGNAGNRTRHANLFGSVDLLGVTVVVVRIHRQIFVYRSNRRIADFYRYLSMRHPWHSKGHEQQHPSE